MSDPVAWIALATLALTFAGVVVMAAVVASKDAEFEAKLPIDELMKKRAVEGQSLSGGL
jgi:hypothetical protein